MKRILLTSTALVALAGAAAAEVSYSGDAEIGYNDKEVDGFYYSFGLSVSASKELDNGITAAMSGDVEFNQANTTAGSKTGTYDGNEITIDDLKVSLSSSTASLTFGDTAPAADALWSGVGNMDADGFNDEDDITDEVGILIGKFNLGSTEVAISNAVVDKELKALQLGVKGSAGSVSYGLAYQSDDNGNGNEVFGVRVGGSFGGADVALGYADNGTETSTGVSVSYPVGDVTIGAFYVMQDVADDNYGISVAYASGPLSVDALFHDGNDEDMQLNVGYDMGNGLNLYGGYRAEGSGAADIFYLGGDYDMGGGATLRMSFVDVDGTPATSADEFGKNEALKEGFTVEVGFKF